MRKIDLLKKYRSFIAYAFFGICTTLVNILCYRVFYFTLALPNVAATMLAWLLAVLFAFVTNKLWVFKSPSFAPAVLMGELMKFFVCRIATGLLDVTVMWLAVDKMRQNAMLWKVISNVVVIVLNYVASKLVIFVRKDA